MKKFEHANNIKTYKAYFTQVQHLLIKIYDWIVMLTQFAEHIRSRMFVYIRSSRRAAAATATNQHRFSSSFFFSHSSPLPLHRRPLGNWSRRLQEQPHHWAIRLTHTDHPTQRHHFHTIRQYNKFSRNLPVTVIKSNL